jgi:hypothetical protein
MEKEPETIDLYRDNFFKSFNHLLERYEWKPWLGKEAKFFFGSGIVHEARGMKTHHDSFIVNPTFHEERWKNYLLGRLMSVKREIEVTVPTGQDTSYGYDMFTTVYTIDDNGDLSVRQIIGLYGREKPEIAKNKPGYGIDKAPPVEQWRELSEVADYTESKVYPNN